MGERIFEGGVMADFPALPLWTDAYLADTMHMSCLESGAYLHLLMAAWRTPECTLPDDDKMLGRMARCTPREWAKVRVAVMSLWTLSEVNTSLPGEKTKTWSQKRLLKERDYVREKSDQRKRAAESRWLKENETCDATASSPHMRDTPVSHMRDHMRTACETDAPIPIPSKKERKDVLYHRTESALIQTRAPKADFNDHSAEFDLWYVIYPLHKARRRALTAYRAARKKTDAETLIRAAERYRDDPGRDPKFTKHPATWLNAECWADEQPTAATALPGELYPRGYGGYTPPGVGG